MLIPKYLTIYTGLTEQQLFPNLVKLASTATDVFSITYWNVPNVTQPTPDQLAAALLAPDPGPTQAQLVALLIPAASQSCALITGQVVPDPTHQNAYNIAMAILVQTGGVAPTSGPFEADFNSLAAAQGFTPTAFAVAAMAVSNGGLALSAALATLEGTASTATTAAQLSAALTAFETALAAIATAITAAGVPVTAPAHIVIVGINA